MGLRTFLFFFTACCWFNKKRKTMQKRCDHLADAADIDFVLALATFVVAAAVS